MASQDYKTFDDCGSGEGYEEATTANDYAAILTWPCARVPITKALVLANTHAANGLKYKVLVRAIAGGSQAENTAETVLAAEAVALIEVNKAVAEIEVQVASNVADTPATARVDYRAQAV